MNYLMIILTFIFVLLYAIPACLFLGVMLYDAIVYSIYPTPKEIFKTALMPVNNLMLFAVIVIVAYSDFKSGRK